MPVDLNKIKSFWENDAKKKQEMGIYAKRDGLNYFTIKDDGAYEVRVLSLGTFYAGSHWGILEGREGRNGGTVKCPRVFDNSPCPVCELVEQFHNSEDKNDREQADKWKVQVRYPVLLVDLNESGGTLVPRIYEAPKTVFEGIVKWITNPKYRDVTDLETGRNLTIIRSRDSRKDFVQYDVQPDPTQSKIDIDPETIPDLEDALRPRSYEDIQYAIQNGEYPQKKEETEVRKAAAPVAQNRKPTPYGKGLPATKTREEEAVEEVQDTPDVPKAVANIPATLGRAAARVSTPAPEKQAIPVAPAPAGQKLGLGASVRDRLRMMKEQQQ